MSVIGIDNASIHPTSQSRKQDIKNWLDYHSIHYSDDIFAPELYKLVLQHNPKFIPYKLDGIVNKHGQYFPPPALPPGSK